MYKKKINKKKNGLQKKKNKKKKWFTKKIMKTHKKWLCIYIYMEERGSHIGVEIDIGCGVRVIAPQ